MARKGENYRLQQILGNLKIKCYDIIRNNKKSEALEEKRKIRKKRLRQERRNCVTPLTNKKNFHFQFVNE